MRGDEGERARDALAGDVFPRAPLAQPGWGRRPKPPGDAPVGKREAFRREHPLRLQGNPKPGVPSGGSAKRFGGILPGVPSCPRAFQIDCVVVRSPRRRKRRLERNVQRAGGDVGDDHGLPAAT